MLFYLPRLINGETPAFRYNRPGAFVCLPCGRRNVPTLIPVDEAGDDVGADLCESCTMRLFDLPLFARATWPSLTPLEVQALWSDVRAQKRKEALAIASRPSARTSVQDVANRLKAALTVSRREVAFHG